MPKVVIREGETIEAALARFKRQVRDAGILEKTKEHESFINASTKRKNKSKAAQQRKMKRRKF